MQRAYLAMWNVLSSQTTFYKGTSPLLKLFELVLRLRTLQMTKGLVIHVIHVSGKCTITQGTDGLSHGMTTAVIMTRVSFGSFVPRH